MASGCADRSARVPNNRFPMASPPMNTAKTTVCAWTVLPNIKVRYLDQTTSYTNAVAPEQKNRNGTNINAHAYTRGSATCRGLKADEPHAHRAGLFVVKLNSQGPLSPPP